MTNQEFAKKVRANRGKLTSMDPELECINTIGIPGLISMVIINKTLGIAKFAEISRTTAIKQVDFLKWMKSKNNSPSAQEVDLYIASL